ncbi:MAG TPA: glycogen-binding domain-containing protein [Verrucomicrobiota bacterium]|nr:glycogen-binding domain-containing protein [Verrucomicrobiota bacterium]
MKKHNTKHKPLGRSPAQRIRIEFTHQSAARVMIAGSFNDWRPEATPMIPMGEGQWAKELVLPPGQYEYCVVVDGNYLPDPKAPQTAPNPFGGLNSVLRVEPLRPAR